MSPPVIKTLRDFVKYTPHPDKVYNKVVIGFDPGHTTGICIMHDLNVVRCEQIQTPSIATTWDNINDIFDWAFATYNKDSISVACEDYRIYDWKAEAHSWQQVHTIKVVGLIQMLCYKHSIDSRLHMRMAQGVKQFVTDARLTMFGLTGYPRHARDALRHAVYHCLQGCITVPKALNLK